MNIEFYMFDIWILKVFQCKIYESPEACDVLFYYNTSPISHFIFVTTHHCPSWLTLNLFLLLKQGNYSFRKIVLCKDKHWTLNGRNNWKIVYILVLVIRLVWLLTVTGQSSPLPVIISLLTIHIHPTHEWFSTSPPSNLHLFFTINWREDLTLLSTTVPIIEVEYINFPDMIISKLFFISGGISIPSDLTIEE